MLLIAIVLLLRGGDALHLSPAERATIHHRYDLIGWEVANLPAKWIARLGDLFPWSGSPEEERRLLLDRYLELTVQVREARSELDRAKAASDAGEHMAALEDRMELLQAEQDALRDDVEELLEGTVSRVVAEQGLNLIGDLIWPPVDARLDRTPYLLVTSPRNRIERLEDVLLEPNPTVGTMGVIENQLLEMEDLSAVVVKTGGVATYPTVVPDDADLARLLELTAHEWLHTYLFFHPLGQGMFRGEEMSTLNETLANMFGREVGGLAYEYLTGIRLPGPGSEDSQPEESDESAFSFERFMRGTRLETDELLEHGDIEGAERYMEERRIELNSHGYTVRKINQAWFAFHGTYADSPASVSPIAGELGELRARVSGVGEMVRLVQEVSSYEEFRSMLTELRAEREPEAGDYRPAGAARDLAG